MISKRSVKHPDYVKTVSAVVKNKFNISAAIITEDYYSYLKEYLPLK